MQDKRFRGVVWLWTISIVLLFSWLTKASLVITHDSLFYLEGANQLLTGQGFYNYFWGTLKPDTHYGPLYSLAIASISFLSGLSVTSAAKVLMALVLALNMLLFARLLAHFALRPMVRYALLFILPFLPPFWLIHTHLWSEALYLSFFLLALWLALIKKPAGRWYGIGLILGLSVLVRFSALFMLPLFGLWLWLDPATKGVKIKHFIGYSSLALLPFVGWSLRNKWVGDSLSSRTLFWDWAGNYPFLNAANTVFFWLGLSLPLLFIVLVSYRTLFQNRLYLLWMGYPVVYVLLLVLAKSTIDPEIPLDSRLLSALLPLFWLIVVAFWSQSPTYRWHNGIWVMAILLTLLQMMRSIQLYKKELGIYPQLLRQPLEAIQQLPAQHSQLDTLYCSGFDFNYLRYFSKYQLVFAHDLPKKPLYFMGITATPPAEFNTGAWQLDTLVTAQLWYATPVDYP